MKSKHHAGMLPLLFLLTVLQAHLRAAENRHLLSKELPTGDSGGWCAFSADESTRRLYTFSTSNAFVVDLDKNEVIRKTNIANVQCFAPVPRFKLGFCGAGDAVSTLNLNTFKITSNAKMSGRPEAILTDPNGSLGFVFCSDRSVAVFEPDDGDLMSTFQLPGAPHSAVMDPKSHRVFCSIENENQVVAFTAATKVGALTTWSVAPGEKPASLAFDATAQRLLVGCGNNLFVVMDATTGKVVDSLTVDSGTDTFVFEPGSRQVFATSGKGTISILQLLPQKILLTETLRVPPGSRCIAVDPKTRKLYVGAGDQSKILIFGR
jgi:WD40 repeat protein